MTFPIGFEGRIRARTHTLDGQVTNDLAFHNAVLNSAVERMFDQGLRIKGASEFLFLGTGSTEPSSSDAGLESRSVTLSGKQAELTDSKATGDGVSEFWVELTREWVYDEGEAEGVWSELGLAAESDYSHPFNRALFRDGNGSPTTLTVQSNEFLTVEVTIRISSTFADGAAGSTTLNGASIGFTVEHGDGWTSGGLFQADLGAGVRAYLIGASGATDAPTYDSGTNTVSGELFLDVTGSDQTIDGVSFNGNGEWYRLMFDQPIVKPSTDRMTIPYSISFSRSA